MTESTTGGVRSRLPEAGKRIARALAGLVVVLGLAFAWALFTGDPDVATVGDCMAKDGPNDLRIVDCKNNGEAEFAVTGKVEDKSEADFKNGDVCAAYPQAGNAFWKGEKGKLGYVLCLSELP